MPKHLVGREREMMDAICETISLQDIYEIMRGLNIPDMDAAATIAVNGAMSQNMGSSPEFDKMVNRIRAEAMAARRGLN